MIKVARWWLEKFFTPKLFSGIWLEMVLAIEKERNFTEFQAGIVAENGTWRVEFSTMWKLSSFISRMLLLLTNLDQPLMM